MNFISSITLQFRDAFSSGFTSAKDSLAGMKGALGEINQNQDMNRLAADLAMATSLTEPFRQKLSALMDEPSKLAGTFDSSMRNIQSLTGDSEEDIAKLGRQLLAVGSSAVAGPNAIAGAYYNIASGISDAAFGADAAAVRMNVLETASRLAESGQANLGAATSGLISVVNAYGVSAENVGAQSDVFFQTVRMGVGSLDGFVSAMATVAGTAANLRVGFGEVGAAMAYITSKGPSEAEAATQINAAMTALLKPNSDMAKVLQALGVESGSAMIRQHGLAESLYLIKNALGGSDDAMAQALGRTEALKAATYLTQESYENFAASYAGGLSGATAAALEAQAQSYEARVAKLRAASDSLKIQIGGDVNAIKGFFVDMGAGFLNHVVSPLMSSPAGEVFQGFAAGAGLLAQGVLSVGSGVLNTASQLVVFTATLQNAGGFSKLFGSALGGMLGPLKNIGTSIAGMIGPLIAKTAATFAATAAELGFAGAMWATAGAVWAATWPILAVAAAVGALALGGYMLVKHWDAVSAFFVNLWNKITGAFSAAFNGIKNLLSGVPGWALGAAAVFLPFVGIPLLIIKYWEGIKSFFAGLWQTITAAFSAAWTWMANLFVSTGENVSAFFVGLWLRAKGLFISLWEGITDFFTGLWNGIVSITAAAAAWFIGVWHAVTAVFAAAWAWAWASDLFMSIWNNVTAFFVSVWNVITGVVADAANWFGEVWGSVTGTFAAAWMWAADLFTSVWESIKGVVMGFVEWLSPVVDMIIAPFKTIGNVIGGIINMAGGWFGETADRGRTEIARMNANNAARGADARPAESAAPVTRTADPVVPAPETASPITMPSFSVVPVVPAPETASPAAASVLAAINAVSAPSLAGTAAPSIGAETTTAGTSTALAEHLAAASRKGIEGTAATTASDAFMGTAVNIGELNRRAPSSPFLESRETTNAAITPAVNMGELNRRVPSNPFLESLAAANTELAPGAPVTPGIDMADFENGTAARFQEAVSPRRAAVETPWNAPEARREKPAPKVFNIHTVNLNADDIYRLLDFARQLEHAVLEPVEAEV